MRAHGGRRVTAIAVVVMVVSACASDGPDDGPANVAAPPAVEPAGKPEVVLPEEVPTSLLVEEPVTGEGDPAQAGDVVTVHLVTFSLATGREIDSTWELAAPRRIPLVDGGAVPGLLQGLVGATVGSRRSVVVPPELAYGAAGAPPDVGPGETLLFVVDVLAISPATD